MKNISKKIVMLLMFSFYTVNVQAIQDEEFLANVTDYLKSNNFVDAELIVQNHIFQTEDQEIKYKGILSLLFCKAALGKIEEGIALATNALIAYQYNKQKVQELNYHFGNFHRKSGEFEAAIDHYNLASRHADLKSLSTLAKGHCYLSNGTFCEAANFYNEFLDLNKDEENVNFGYAYWGLGEITTKEMKYQESFNYYNIAKNTFTNLKDIIGLAYANLGLAELCIAQNGDKDNITNLLLAAQKTFEEQEDAEGKVLTYLVFGAFLRSQRDIVSQEYIDAAFDIAQKAGMRHIEYKALALKVASLGPDYYYNSDQETEEEDEVLIVEDVKEDYDELDAEIEFILMENNQKTYEQYDEEGSSSY